MRGSTDQSLVRRRLRELIYYRHVFAILSSSFKDINIFMVRRLILFLTILVCFNRLRCLLLVLILGEICDFMNDEVFLIFIILSFI